MTAIEALIWIFENFDKNMKPSLCGLDIDTQIATYSCWGCNGIFESKYPEWEKPTDETFSHEEDCKYMAAKRLISDNNIMHSTKLPAAVKCESGLKGRLAGDD